MVKKYLNISESCQYRLVIKSVAIHNCNNPQVKSLGSDIDGYVKLELYADKIMIFRSQTDFKGDDHSSHLQRLIKDLLTLPQFQEVRLFPSTYSP